MPVQQISSETAHQLILQNKLFLLDVRQIEEYRSGHIKGSTLIALPELETKFKKEIVVDFFQAKWPEVKPMDFKEYNFGLLCICRSGYRSDLAGNILQNLFPELFEQIQIYNLIGGVQSWNASGFELE